MLARKHTRGRPRKHSHSLGERDPSLIDLPIPVPSIPILNPIITALVGGPPAPQATSSSQAAPAPSPTTAAPPAPAPSPPPNNGGSSSSPGDGNGSSGNGNPGDSNNSGNDNGGSSNSGGDPSGSGGNTGGSGNSPSSGGGNGSNASNNEGDNGSSSSTTSGGNGGDSGNNADGSDGSDSGASSASSSSSSSNPSNDTPPSGSSGSSDDRSPSASSVQGTEPFGGSSASESLPSGQALSTSSASGAVSFEGIENVGASPTNAVNGDNSSGSSSLQPAENASPSGTNSPVFVAATGATLSNGQHTPSPTGASSNSGSSSGTDNGTGSGNPNNGGPSDTSTEAESHHSGLSTGAIAAISVISILLFLLLLLLILRKRSMLQRASRRQWWFGGKSTVYGNAAISSSRYFAEHNDSPGRRASARSSFATNFDRGQLFTPEPAEVPPPPPVISLSLPPILPVPQMQQVWTHDLNGSFTASYALAAQHDSTPTVHSPDGAYQQSSDSLGLSGDESRSSSQMSQYLLVPDSATTAKLGSGFPSPISVRPFSPSDRWAFPKPPKDRSNAAQNRDPALSPLDRASPASQLDRATPSESHYLTATENEHENPFSDFAGSVESEMTSTDGAESFVSADSETAAHFAEIEVIRRPFVPSLPDEMSATPGERVRMLRRFDDGWAYAEKVDSGRKGLVPIDCLRTAEQDLPAFLAAKRLSSYHEAPALRASVVSAESQVGRAV
ncbi:hypothetical protein CERSUDRAFT_80960 [Gelatoporia subvermispora B]|uniref:SH3 domain-containing protein n=1 Tax=Ceriporiopsis subvermispora (strain B) TaxID=914234 RepID=M2QR69_CERS8|nr:hypothetical protein CERSUDRAFT_80960 [Gelatoporia subvermispora B]